MTLEFCPQTFEKSSNIKFHENPFTRSRVVQCGRMEGRTHMATLLVASRNFANAPKKGRNSRLCVFNSGLRKDPVSN